MSFGTKGCMYNCGDTCTGECIKPEEKTARKYNSPIIQELMDEITPEEMQATEVRMLQELIHKQEDLDPEFNEIISENFWDLVDNESPYCPVCDACGEEGCCSATACEQHPDGSYCATYLKDLKFGYRMNKFFENEIADYLSPYAKEKYNDEWNRIYDEIYGNNK